MTLPPTRVPIGERGGRSYPVGTVYYSSRDRTFYAAGREDQGPLALDSVSGAVSWNVNRNGVFQLRDQTGVFIPRNVFSIENNTAFGRQFLQVDEAFLPRSQVGFQPTNDQQIVERITYLRPDGKIVVREIPYGLGNEYDPRTMGRRWFFEGQSVLQEEGRRPSYKDIKAAILSTQVLVRTNLGPRP